MAGQDHRIIVAIDFGTTFSGIAFAQARRPDSITTITSWPSSLGEHEGISHEKVPTELFYDEAGLHWGYQIPYDAPDASRRQWFKLGLQTGSMPENLPVCSKGSPELLTTQYFSALSEHLKYMLQHKFGDAASKLPIEITITVPAIWTESAVASTLKAVEKARLPTKSKIGVVTEPEAAAIYALDRLPQGSLKPGDTFVLVDAGGGTTDLISYTIKSLEPFEIVEAAAGSGECCGGAFIDFDFKQLITSKLSRLEDWDEHILATAMSSFQDGAKRTFNPSTITQTHYSINVAGLPNSNILDIQRGHWKVKTFQLKVIFDRVINKIVDLTKAQMLATQTSVKAILLVGGMGQNVYLRESLRKAINGKGKPEISVMQPEGGVKAVVHGAVILALTKQGIGSVNVHLSSRVARKHYGVRLSFPYSEAIHSGMKRSRYIDEVDGFPRIELMKWFCKKGEMIPEDGPVQIEFYLQHKVSYGYPLMDAIELYTDTISRTAPEQVNRNVKLMVTLKANLTKIPESRRAKLINRQADGEDYYIFNGYIEANFSSADVKYTMIIGDDRYDTVTCQYA